MGNAVSHKRRGRVHAKNEVTQISFSKGLVFSQKILFLKKKDFIYLKEREKERTSREEGWKERKEQIPW